MNKIRTRDYASLMVTDKAFGARNKTACYESRRMKDLHRAFLTCDYDKYLFSETSVIRAKNMDFSKVSPESLANIFLKTGKECGIIMLPAEYGKINFQYAILPNHILLNVFQGSYHDAQKARSEDEFNCRFSNVYLGEVVIADNKIDASPFSVLNILIDALHTNQIDRLQVALKDDLYGKQIRLAWKEIDGIKRETKTAETLQEVLDPKQHPFLCNEFSRAKATGEKLMTALKCFVFLKCAKVIDKTFIADNTPMTTYRRLRKESNVDYIFVDGHWDSDIKVINPFQVSGHFRHQPKKNDKGEWYKELIYIDSFMKQGYTRRATKEKVEQGKRSNYERVYSAEEQAHS